MASTQHTSAAANAALSLARAITGFTGRLLRGVKVDSGENRRKEAAASSKPVDLLTQCVDDFVARGEVDDRAKALVQGATLLRALIAVKRAPKALPVLRKLKEVDPAFAPDADSILALAEAALGAKNLHLAVDLVKEFDKRFPGHADIPGVYFLGARISSEHLAQDAKAIAILKVLLNRYPDAAVSEEAKKYLAALTHVAATRAYAAAK
jgi:outer membrane protein assembly factor BamD (BamD/ComL family)